MKASILTCIALAANICLPLLAKPSADTGSAAKDFQAPKNAVILIIRHAEKPEHGPELAPAGQQRAAAYPAYFKSFAVDSQPLQLDAIYATADSKGSHRPRLTVEPLSRALGLSIHNRFKDAEVSRLAAEISSKPRDKRVLICWHHGEIPNLLAALGADPATLLPGGKWPNAEFGWVLELRYDKDGRLIPGESRRIEEDIKLGAR